MLTDSIGAVSIILIIQILLKYEKAKQALVLGPQIQVNTIMLLMASMVACGAQEGAFLVSFVG